MLLMDGFISTFIPRARLAEMIHRARKRKASIMKTNHSITIGDLKALFFPAQQTA